MSEIDVERWNIDFSVAKSLRYHAYRRDFWDRFDNAAKILTGISSAGVLLTVIQSSTALATGFAITVAVISVVDVVLRFGKRARKHDGLYRDFSLLAQDIAAKESPTKAEVARWRKRRLAIEMHEPGVMDLLERRCAAEECVARGVPIRPDWHLNWFQVLVCQYWIFALPRSLSSDPNGGPAKPPV